MSQASMQQIIIIEPGDIDKLAYETVAIPEAKADEVLVKVHAFGINRPDILQRQGLYPMPKGVTPVPGLEVAGEVSLRTRSRTWPYCARVNAAE